MEIRNLKNYGKSLLEMTNYLPEELIKEISESGSMIMKKHLGAENMEAFASALSAEKQKMQKQNFSSVCKKGLDNEVFIRQQIEWAASFSAVSKIRGKEKAFETLGEIAEQTYPKMFFVLFPVPENLKEYDDPFNAFKEWFSAMMNANRKIGIFDYELSENTHDTFQINCTWCVWHEIYKHLGVEEACLPVCHTDDIFFPDYCWQLGIRYKRTSTLANGGHFCDYRFER